MNLEPISLGIGCLIGLAVGLFRFRGRVQAAAQAGMRDLQARLNSVNIRLERTQNELAATKGVVARLLDDRSKHRDNWQDGDGSGSQLTVVLNDTEGHQLSQVRGIGPKLALTLASYGINDLARLADITERDLSVIEASAPNLAERIVRERWKEQALQLLQAPAMTRDEYSEDEHSMTPAADEYSWAQFRRPPQGRAANGSSS